MGRPLVTSAVGLLPANILAPPPMKEELRTGWVVAQPGNVGEIARASSSNSCSSRIALPKPSVGSIPRFSHAIADRGFRPVKRLRPDHP